MSTSIGAIQIPSGVLWINQYNYTPTVTTKDISITGALLIQHQNATSGRPIILESTQNHGWVTRTLVDQLRADSETLTTKIFTAEDSTTYNVHWDHSSGFAIVASPLLIKSKYEPDDFFIVTLNLITVEV
jgi:hypothetical protein